MLKDTPKGVDSCAKWVILHENNCNFENASLHFDVNKLKQRFPRLSDEMNMGKRECELCGEDKVKFMKDS